MQFQESVFWVIGLFVWEYPQPTYSISSHDCQGFHWELGNNQLWRWFCLSGLAIWVSNCALQFTSNKVITLTPCSWNPWRKMASSKVLIIKACSSFLQTEGFFKKKMYLLYLVHRNNFIYNNYLSTYLSTSKSAPMCFLWSCQK